MNLKVKTNHELDDTYFWMPLSFRQLLVWGKCRNFQQDMELDGVVGLPLHLIVFATSLKGGLAGSLSGPGTGPPRVGVRALIIAINKIPLLFPGAKRKYNCIRTGSQADGHLEAR